MPQSLAHSRLDVPRKAVAARLSEGAKPNCKPVAVEWKRRMGLAIERALVLANLTKQDVSFQMGYPDQSALSRWIAGTEPTQWHKLMAVDQLRPWIPVAIAEQAGVDVQTIVCVRRTA